MGETRLRLGFRPAVTSHLVSLAATVLRLANQTVFSRLMHRVISLIIALSLSVASVHTFADHHSAGSIKHWHAAAQAHSHDHDHGFDRDSQSSAANNDSASNNATDNTNDTPSGDHSCCHSAIHAPAVLPSGLSIALPFVRDQFEIGLCVHLRPNPVERIERPNW